jgi:nucleoside-diphosphate-sugar epimerase
MIVAITGGTGFVGTEVARAHLDRGDDVRVLSRHQSISVAGIRLVRGDLVHGDVPPSFLAGADVLYHCAGELRDEDRMHALHVEGTRRLLTLARGSVGRWVHLSSVGVYGPRRGGTITENTPEAPVGRYEVTKAQSDSLVREAHARGTVEAVIVRPSNIFGPTMRNRSLFHLIASIDRGVFFFIGPRGASANYIPVENVVDALLLSASAPSAAGCVFNLSAYTRMEAFVAAIASALGKAPPRLRIPRLPVRAVAAALSIVPGWPLSVSRVDALSTRTVYSTALIESQLGYRPRVSIHDALERTVAEWRREHSRL